MHNLLSRYYEQLQTAALSQVNRDRINFVVILADTSDAIIRGFIRRVIDMPFPLSEHYAEHDVKHSLVTSDDLESLAAQVEGQFQDTSLLEQSLDSTTHFLVLLLLPGHVETAVLPLPDPE